MYYIRLTRLRNRIWSSLLNTLGFWADSVHQSARRGKNFFTRYYAGVYELEWLRYQLGCFSTATFLKDEIKQRGK